MSNFLRFLRIKNFKSYKLAKFTFVPGVNVITGIPQAGKTNFLRAFNWLVTNRPKGQKFRSNFAESPETSVTAGFDDVTVSLSKKKSKAVYKVEDREYKGFKHSVPEPVSSALNLSDLNTQFQLDQSYLITAPPGEIARTINRLTKMEPVDQWVSTLTTMINTCERDKERDKEELEKAEKHILKYAVLDDVEIGLRKVKKYELQEQSLSREYLEITDLIEQIKEVRSNKQLKETVTSASQLKNVLVKSNDRIDDLQEELDIIQSWRGYKRDKIQLKRDLEQHITTLSDYKEVTNTCDKLLKQQEILLEYEESREEADRIRETMAHWIALFTDLLRTKGKCPVCFRPISEGTIDRILEEL